MSSLNCRAAAASASSPSASSCAPRPSGHRPATRSRGSSSPLPGRAPRRLPGRAVRPGRDGVLETERVRAAFDLDDGRPARAALDGRNVLVDGPRLQLWRAPTDNDGLPQLPSRQ